MGDRYSDNSLDKTAIDDRFVTTSVSSGSEVCTFTDYGLKRALERSVLRPTMPITHRDQKDAEYIEYIAQQRQLLRDQLRGAEQRYNEIDEERDANEDSIQAIWLHAAWLRASNDLQRAERSYNIFMDEIKVLLEMPPIPRADMYSEVTVKRNQAHRDLKEAEAIEDALLEPSNRSKFEMATLKKEVRDLKVQLTEASKSFTWAQEEINRMRDYNVAAIQKHVKTTQELQMQLGSSRLREEYLEEEIQGYDNELARQDELLRQFKSGAQPYPADAMI
ncbi:hypothetical protein B0A55_00339 [Friedmanniomyces simplex]|uniref:Uncharacterized protein n=1 Tax=Friedmanniomyces simplex TaxID=329884 RepID=A0A4U0XZA4_9PEZI|nr:hypothetical protein B0A55_00339 [Friedmanniomyces simplex]